MTRLQKFLDWLKGLFIHPKEEKPEMSEALNDTAVVQAANIVDPQPVVNDPITPEAEVKAGVQDFEKAFQFVADGVVQLGAGAKDELVALAKKYL